MTIRKVQDKQTWNRFVEKNAPQAFFQSWEWGEVEKRNGCQIARWGLYKHNRLTATAQTSEVNAKRGNYLQIRHGPILPAWKEAYLRTLICFLSKKAKKRHLAFIRISPLCKKNNIRLLSNLGFHNAPIHNMDAQITYLLDLKRDLKEILLGMRKNTRRLLHKMNKEAKLQIKSGLNKKLLGDFLNLFWETAQKAAFIADRGIENEIQIFGPHRQAEIIMAYHQTKPAAGALISYWGNQAIYRYAATSAIGRRTQAAYLVQWTAIKNSWRRGCHYYNLWGGIADLQDKTHPWHGITVFKRGFGGKKREYLHAQDLALSKLYWKTYWIETAIKYIRGYNSLLGLRAPAFLRRVFNV